MKILRRTLIVILFAVISSHTYAQLGGGIFSNSAKRIWGLGAAALPANCTTGDVFVPNAPVVGIYLCTVADTWTLAGPGAGVAWGAITGTLSNQTDLQNALNLKAPLASPVFTGHVTVEGVLAGGATGTGSFVFNNTPTLITPILGVATATSLNGNTFTTGTYTVTGAAAKTLTFSNTLTLAGTDSTTMTFPSTSATIARTDAANTFAGHQTIEGVATTGATGTNLLVFGTSPTIVTPTIASFTNAPHNHQNAAGGGTLDVAAIGSGTLGTARGGTGNTSGTATVNANLTGPITSVGNATTIAPNPAVTGLTSDTISTSGNAGVGVAPNATSGRRLDVLQTGNQLTVLDVRNSDAADAGAAAVSRAVADTAVAQIVAYGTAFSATVFGVNIGGWSSLNNAGAGSGLLIGTTNSTPIRFGTNSTLSMLVDTSQGVTFSGAIIPSQTIGITGTTTNNNANAGAFGEYQTGTVAANTTSLSTGTTINVGTNTNITLTAGDWDCTGVVNFTFGATTSITNLTGGISTTTGTLPAQDSYFDYETSAVIPTGTAVATWVVPTVRLSNSGSTNVFLVSQATFTASTIKVGGTIRCRRMR